jgi:hypothetical protein
MFFGFISTISVEVLISSSNAKRRHSDNILFIISFEQIPVPGRIILEVLINVLQVSKIFFR